jgi:hypothetical protein
MADEKTNVTETTTTKKTNICTNILTYIICAIVGAGIYFGADAVLIQKTIDEALAKQIIADVTAVTVADTIANEGLVSVVISDEKKAEITATETAKNTTDDAVKKFIEDAKAAVQKTKEAVKATEALNKDIKDAVEKVVDEVKDKV